MPIPQPTWKGFVGQRASQQIREKLGTQGFNGNLVEGGKKATEGGTSREAIASEERHERVSPGGNLFVKGFKGALTTDSVAEKHGDKINHVILAETATGKAHLLCDGGKHAMTL